MTAGATPETVDGMSLEKIQDIIEALRFERYRWTPVRRTYIPKKTGKLASARCMPTWSDKLLQEVDAADSWRRTTNRNSATARTDFGRGRGCHSALREIYYHWRGTIWFIEGDIRGCFDNIDHQVLMSILREKILDQPLPPADREPAQGRISGGLAVSRDPEWFAARGHREPHPRQHLP